MKKRRIILGIFGAPLVCAISINSLFAGIFWVQSLIDGPAPENTLRFPNPERPWEFVFLFSIYGIPTAIITLVTLWFPLCLVLKKAKILNIYSEIILSVILSIPAMFIFQIYNSILGVLFMAAHGIGTGRAFMWISKINQAEENTEPNQSLRNSNHRRLTRRYRQRPTLSRNVLRAAHSAPAQVVSDLGRSAKKCIF
jgi:hypothetical protein